MWRRERHGNQVRATRDQNSQSSLPDQQSQIQRIANLPQSAIFNDSSYGSSFAAARLGHPADHCQHQLPGRGSEADALGDAGKAHVRIPETPERLALDADVPRPAADGMDDDEVKLAVAPVARPACDSLASRPAGATRWTVVRCGWRTPPSALPALASPATRGMCSAGRPCLTYDATGASLRDRYGRSYVCDRPTAFRQAQKFDRATSRRIELSSVCSATGFFSRAFSRASSLRRVARSIRIPQYSRRRRQ